MDTYTFLAARTEPLDEPGRSKRFDKTVSAPDLQFVLGVIHVHYNGTEVRRCTGCKHARVCWKMILNSVESRVTS